MPCDHRAHPRLLDDHARAAALVALVDVLVALRARAEALRAYLLIACVDLVDGAVVQILERHLHIDDQLSYGDSAAFMGLSRGGRGHICV